MAHLLITAGPDAGKYFPLANRPLAAGRDPARDIQLLDPKVSRKHFMVRKAGDEFVIVPFRSVNGVILNGEALSDESVLCDRDKIEVGDTTLRFRINDDADRTNALDQQKAAGRQAREDQTITDRS